MLPANLSSFNLFVDFPFWRVRLLVDMPITITYMPRIKTKHWVFFLKHAIHHFNVYIIVGVNIKIVSVWTFYKCQNEKVEKLILWSDNIIHALINPQSHVNYFTLIRSTFVFKILLIIVIWGRGHCFSRTQWVIEIRTLFWSIVSDLKVECCYILPCIV